MSHKPNPLGTVSFRVKVGVGAAVTLAAVATTVAFALWPAARTSLVFGMAAATAAAAAYAAFFASATLVASLRQHRQRLAIDMLDRLDDVEFNRQRTLLERCNLKGMPQAEAYKAIVENDELYAAARAVLNRLEGVASAIRLGAADEQLMYASLRSMTIRYYDYLYGFITERRKDVSPTAWCQLEKLVTAWRDRKSLFDGESYPE